MAEVTMPRLSDTMSEGTIGRWLKQPGEHVEKGDVLVEIETDKATMELEAYESGILQAILVQAGQTVPIGQPIAIIQTAVGVQQEASVSTVDQSAQSASSSVPERHEQPAAMPTTPAGERVKASPLARRMAEEYGIDLHQVPGTGPGGRVIRENVEDFYQQQVARQVLPLAPSEPSPVSTLPSMPSPAPTIPLHPVPSTPSTPTLLQPTDKPAVPMSRMRRAIAHRMSESKHGTPHFYITSDVDVGALLALRREINDLHASSAKISVNDFIIKAVAKTLELFPVLNSSYVVGQDGQPGVVQHEHINVSVAIAVDDGLIVPVVVDANKKSLGTIAAEVKDLAARAREGKIKQHELEGGTFTVSNLGMFEVTEFIAIITPPQSGVLAVGSIQRVPVVRHHSELTIGDIMKITLSADHRIVDGAVAARFAQHIKHLMEAPMKLVV